MNFKVPSGGFYQFTLRVTLVDEDKSNYFEKVIEAKNVEEAQDLFNIWLKEQNGVGSG